MYKCNQCISKTIVHRKHERNYQVLAQYWASKTKLPTAKMKSTKLRC